MKLRTDPLPKLVAVLAASFILVIAAPVAAFGSEAQGDALVPDDRTEAAPAGIPSEGPAARKKDKKKEAGKEGEAGKAGEGGPKKDDAKPFADVVKDFTAQEGLFTFYRKDDKTYLEIKPDQYDRFYMVSLTRLTGVGAADLLGNQVLGNYPIQFHKVGKSVQVVMKNVFFRSERDASLRRAVERSFSDSIAGIAKVESQPHPDRKSDLVDVSSLFLKDIDRVEQYTDEALRSGYKLDREGSYVGAVKAFPGNVELETVLHFVNPRSNVLPVLPDNRSMLIRYNFSISSLPEGEYRPRLADDRVGHFITTLADYSTDSRHSPTVRYVERWKLDKSDPSARVSPPKEPITFYLDNSIPERYRDAVAQGILVWNKAFERVGFKDAVVVKPQPDDPNWDTADARYSSVRWFVATDSVFAIGPSRSNPFTGQLYDADIAFTESMTRWTRREFRELVDPLARVRAMVAEAASASGIEPRSFGLAGLGSGLLGDPGRLCTLGGEAYRQAGFGWGLLASRGMMTPGSAEEEGYIRDFLISVTAHEVGHTLGLRHNFRASTLHPASDLQNVAKTTEMGLTGSVMEYAAVNLAPQGQRQGQYWQTTLGPYDYWSIEYAYKPIAASSPEEEIPELQKIAARAPEPPLAYATDEDAAGFLAAPIGMDPRNHQWDLGSDPITYYTERVKLARELWASLPGKVTEPGEGYQVVRRAFGQGVGEFFPAITSVTKYVGGVMHNRDHVGDPGGRPPFVPVTAAEQRRALAFLNTYLFAPDAFQFNPDLINSLAAERFGEMTWFILMPRLDYPVHDTVLAMQDLALVRLYHPILLNRVLDADTKVAKGGDHVGMAEIFGTLRDGIWSELAPGSGAAARPGSAGQSAAKAGAPEINSFRRALQRRQLDYLVALATRQRPGAGQAGQGPAALQAIAAAQPPLEATTLARADLMELKGRIAGALKAAGIDAATRAHLIESQAVIDQALDAAFVRSL